MASLQITTKIGCKNACIYCPQDKLIQAYKRRSSILHLDFETFKTFIDKIPLDVSIVFGGMSEPWLNPECTKMLLYAHKNGHKIVVLTTLVGMKSSEIELLERIPYSYFQVHLPTNRGHEKIEIDEDYLNVLEKITASKINPGYHYHGGTLNSKVKSMIESNGTKIELRKLNRRSRNTTLKQIPNLPKRHGVIGCRFHLRSNVLLPNGEVLICANDYGMQHVLGNLLSSSYDSLFLGKEFIKIMNGLRDESLDILCRYCDNLCYDLDLKTKFYNWRYHLDRYLYYMRDIRDLSDVNRIMKKTISILKSRLSNN